MKANLVGISLAWEKNQAVYIPLAHDTKLVPEQLDTQLVLSKLSAIFEDPKKIIMAEMPSMILKSYTGQV